MINLSMKIAWALLDTNERKKALQMIIIMIIGAFFSALMVFSIFPFLSVISDLSRIEEVPALHWAYTYGNFSSQYSFAVILGVVSIFIIIAGNLYLIFQTWAVSRFTRMRLHSISLRLLRKYLYQRYDTLLSNHSGEMTTNILSETQQVVDQFLSPLASILISILTISAITITIILTAPAASISAILALSTMYGGIIVLSRRYIKIHGSRRARANSIRFRTVSEALGGIKDIKIFGRESAFLHRFDQASQEMVGSLIVIGVLSQTPRHILQIATFGGIISICLFLLDPDAISGEGVIGEIFPTLGLLAFAGQRLLPEMNILYHSYTSIAAHISIAEKLSSEVASDKEYETPQNTSPALSLKRKLKLDKVTYTYPNALKPGVKEVSLEMNAGERVGVIGMSGSGKTTLADVILGLLNFEQGCIYADGEKISEVNIREWRKVVGYVPQNIFLVDASLAENIAFGLPSAEIDLSRVEQAAKIAQIHDFAVNEMPDGYDTLIGERGTRLSGGQRQRIGIARALYNNADLIVFDEATSALDNLTEREVMSSIEALPGDKTIIMIAHRLSTLKVCDRIILMEKGHLIGYDTWDALMKTNSVFRSIASHVT